MVKATLDATYIYAGKRYGPGEVDVPKEVHAALSEKGAIAGKKQAAQADDKGQE